MILLPPNELGIAVMMIAIVLLAIVPFVVVLWVMNFFAPWWVAVPVAISASFITLLFTVKRRN